MVITGEPRGNGKQLGDYLLDIGDNTSVDVYDIRGTSQPNDLKKSLLEMSLTSELTNGDMGLYHAQISPAAGEDMSMTREQWLRAADILEEELDTMKGVADKGLSFSKQKRVMVMHDKPGHRHMHVVWERYDHDNGILLPDKFSHYAQNRARRKMELEFDHQLTPLRNKKKPELKQLMSDMWQKTTTGAELIKEAFKKGYVIAKGEIKRPFLLIDETGRSFDLVKQIYGMNTKKVRERLNDEQLPFYKQVMKQIQLKIKDTKSNAATEVIIEQIPEPPKPLTTVEKYQQKEKEVLEESREEKKQRFIQEIQEQIEEQRQRAKERKELGLSL